MSLLDDACSALPPESTPAMIYFESVLAAAFERFAAVTAGVPDRICLYSAKAATFPFLLRALRRIGAAGFDASSPTEAVLVSRALGPRVPLYVTAPGITAADFDLLEPIRPRCVHVDSLDALAVGARRAMPIGVRINPGTTYARQALFTAGGPASRLGLPIDRLGDALDILRRAGRTAVGLHLHTTCEAPDFAMHARAVELLDDALEAVGFDLQITHIDVGGGLLPPMWDYETDTLRCRLADDPCAPLAAALKRLRRRHAKLLAPGFHIVFEPGDFIVAAAGVMVSKVVERRVDGSGRRHLLLDTNINHFPNVLHYGNTPRVIGQRVVAEDDPQGVCLSGNSCLGGDHIARIDADGLDAETVVFDERGSYEYTQYNFFNGRLRPSVFFQTAAGALVPFKVDTVDDLVGYWREQVDPFPQTWQSFHHFENIARETRGMHLYHPDLRMVSSFEFDHGPFGPPAGLAASLAGGFGRSGIYGRSLGTDDVRAHIARYENTVVGSNVYAPERVAMTLGATNGIWLTMESMLAGGLRRLLIPCPTYYQFAATCARRQIPWTAVHQRTPRRLGPDDRGRSVDPASILPGLDDLMQAIDEAPDIGAIVLLSPDLPLGFHQPAATVKAVADRARDEGFLLIVDETLGGLTYAHDDLLDWRWLEPSHPVVRIASISKTFGVPGARLGYLALTEAASRRPDNGADVLALMADCADAAYSAPPALMGPMLKKSLDVLAGWRAGRDDDPDVAAYARNLAGLSANARAGARLLSAAGVPYVMPQAGASLSACLTKLADCRVDAEPFFRRALAEQDLFVETGGHFSQNPAWNFTLARLGLGRADADFEGDLKRLLATYRTFPARGGA